MSKEAERLISEQQSTIRMLLRENERLRETIRELQETLREVAKMWRVEVPDLIWVEGERPKLTSWAERYEQFAGLRSQLLRIVVDMCRVKGGPVSAREVREEFKRRHLGLYARMRNPDETIPRRIRELKAGGYLFSPKQGLFYPTDKAVKIKTPN